MPRPPRSLLVGIGALTLLRFLIAATVPLGDDETFYWEWSRHLAPAYIDHPPAIAFLVWAATRLLGSTPFAVHSVSVVLSFFTSLAVWSLAREVLGRDRAATWAVVLFSAVPVFAAGALLAAPDAPLGLAWVLTLLWAWRAATRDAPRGWLWAGLFLGAALDSKYTAAALPLSVGLWLLLSPRLRRWLLRPEPYLGLALAGAVFSPVVLWNARHQWVSFSFNVLGRPSWDEGGNFPAFLLLQFLYQAPLMFPALLWALGVAARRGLAGSDPWLFLAASGVPVVAAMLGASLFGHVKGHWPAPGYISAGIALAGLATEHPVASRSPLWRAAVAGVLGSTLLVTGAIHLLPLAAPWVLPPRLDPTVDYYGWQQAAPEIAAVAQRDARRPFFIMSDRYQVLAQFDFGTGGRYPATTVTGDDQYALWTRWSRFRGWDGLFIQDGRYPPEVDLNQGCRALEPEAPVTLVRRGIVVRTLQLVWCRNFAGRPIPARSGPSPEPDPPGPGWRFSRGVPPSARGGAPTLPGSG
jgi:4-amino-4-deoxy-L-arabinose transferase-like glycosyltransferase